MSQEVATWDPNSGAALPAHIANAQEQLGSNINDRNRVPSLSYEGKVWSIVKDGNRQKLQMTNADGDVVPIPVMRGVILDFNPDRGRAYYPGTYNPAQTAQPDCWSFDSKKPADNVPKKQHPTCNGCPQSIKGSKVDNGREMIACSAHRLLAIVPPGEDIKDEPLRLKIAATSDYSKDQVEHGFFAFRQYTDYLRSRGINHTGLVVTKIKFDSDPAYPKLIFGMDRVLTQDEVALSVEAAKSDKVKDLLSESWGAAGSQAARTDDRDIRGHGLEAAYADGWHPHPDSSGWSYKDQQVLKNEDVAALYPEPAPPPIPVEEAAPPAPLAAAAPAVPVETALHGLPAALADGWVKHPDGDWHYKGDVVEATDKVAALYPAPVVEEAPPAAPPPPPPAPETPPFDPMAAALADGWVKHPDGDWLYKGSDVVVTADVLARYEGNAATGGTPAAPAAASESSGQTAQTSASPSSPEPSGSAEVPPEVAGLLGKWG